MEREKRYCKKCKKTKNIDNFYKNNLSQCKNCKKEINKNSKFTKNEVENMLETLTNRLNYMEILFKESFKRTDSNTNTYKYSIFFNSFIEMIILKDINYKEKIYIIDTILDFMINNNIQINNNVKNIYIELKDDKEYEIDNILNNIDNRNKKINDNINTIINFNKNIINDKYENELNNILNK